MKGAEKQKRQTVKIKYISQGRTFNKLASCKDLNYAKFTQKLTSTFDIHPKKLYRLYYLDDSKEDITINVEDDYSLFIEMADPLILYFQVTEDSDLDFRKHAKNASETFDSSSIQQSQLIIKERENPQLKNKLLPSKGPVSSYQPISVDQPSLESPKKSKKSLEKNSLFNVIKQERSRVLAELAQFKRQLQENSKKVMREKLQQIRQGLEKKYTSRSGDFEHNFGCQKPKYCKFDRKIIGLRYMCIICSVHFCENCADQEHKGPTFTHDPTHPMVKYRNSKWDDKLIIMQDPDTKTPKPSEPKLSRTTSQKKKEQQLRAKTTHLALLLQIPEAKARDLVLKYPNLSENELFDKAFDTLR